MITFKFPVNTQGRDKDWNYEALATQFKDKSGTLDDVIAHVKSGHALCAGLLGGKRRAKGNVIGAQWLLLDVDNSTELKGPDGKSVKGTDGKVVKIYQHELSLPEAIAHPFVQEHCSLIYTTPSHKPEWPKFRMVFLLPEYLEGARRVEAAIKLLMAQLPHDEACKDAGRVFYGNSKAEFPLINHAATLPFDWIEQAELLAEKAEVERQQRLEVSAAKRRQYQEQQSDEQVTPAALLSQIDPDSSYQIWLDCLFAAHHEGIPEAEVRRWSSGSAKHCDRVFDQKWKSIKGRAGGCTAGTLWHYAIEQGWQPPKRQTNQGEPDQLAYQQYRQMEDERSRVEAVEAEHSNLERLREWASRLKSGIGFGKKPPRTAPEVKQIRYVPGKLPHRGEFEKVPQILYREGQLLDLLVEAQAKGWPDVLDTGATGSGKSHAYASLRHGMLLRYLQSECEPDQEVINRVWLLSTNHRNPTTLPAEANFTDLPTRNHGLISDTTRQTPLGENFQRWPKSGEKSEDAGNCNLTHLFHRAAAKGIAAASAPGAGNPICGACAADSYCGKQTGKGYGFRAQRAEVFQRSQAVRAHLDSMPDPSDIKSE